MRSQASLLWPVADVPPGLLRSREARDLHANSVEAGISREAKRFNFPCKHGLRQGLGSTAVTLARFCHGQHMPFPGTI